jgi:hypothetical protein
MRKYIFVLLTVFSVLLIGCASTKAYKKLNSDNPDEIARGNPNNTIEAKQYLETVLANPEGRAVKVYTRRAFSPDTKKNFFLYHMFYVYFLDGTIEHTLVFTATPDGAELDGCWMLDAQTDIESYTKYVDGDNEWEVVEYKPSKRKQELDFTATTQNILERIDKGYTWSGSASVRNLPWYHLLWMSILVPPPLSPEIMMLIDIGNDNCTSAVMGTVAWKKD